MNCTLHKSFPLEYFCETCMDPICSQCVKSNPHSNEYHRICPIEQAVQNRKQNFYTFIENSINPLRQKMRQKLQQLKEIESQQIQYRNIIQKDIQLDFEAIDHRLKQKSEKKTLQYHTQIKYYQAYLNNLDDIVYTFDKTSSDPYNFLILYQEIHNELKKLELKEITQKIESFQINDQNNKLNESENVKKLSLKSDIVFLKLSKQLDLPRQFKKTQAKLSTLNAIKERNQFTNQIISKACQNYQEQQKNLRLNAQIEYKRKLKIFNETNKNIIELYPCKACAFCGSSFSIDALNDQCPQNKSMRVQILKQYSNLTIQAQFKGTKRHYWVNSSISDRKVPDPNGHPLLRNKEKKQFLNSIKDLQIVKYCFRDYQIDHAKVDSEEKIAHIDSFISIFQEADKEKKGFLSKITFKYILTKTFHMDALHCEVLTELLSYKWKIPQKISETSQQISKKSSQVNQSEKQSAKIQLNQGVNYLLLKQFVKDPQFLFKEWQKIEEQSDKSKPVGPTSKDTNKYKSRY